ncbi:MAG TPA: SurA N-terminal domain-containing protein, partial [Urbifossiella sp.]
MPGLAFRRGGLVFAIVVSAGLAWADPPKKTEANPVAAIVNGEEIRLAEIDAFVKTKLALVPITEMQVRQLRTEVVSELVDDLLLRQFLAKNAPKVEAAEIDKQVEVFTAALRSKGKTFAEFLKETNQTEAELRRNWTVLLQLDGYTKKTTTEDQLKRYYAANKDYFDHVEVKASHIMLHVSSKASP